MKIDLKVLFEQSGLRRVRRSSLRVRVLPVGMESSVESIFAAVVRAWNSALNERILPQYERPVQDGYPEARAAIEVSVDETSRTVIYQTERLGRWVTRTGDWHTREFVAASRSAVGVDVSPYVTLTEVQPQLEAAIKDGASRLRLLDAQMRSRVEALVFRAFQDRWTKKRLVAELRAATDSTVKAARRRARDFSSTIQSVLDEYRYLQFGLLEYVWRTMGDDRVRTAHALRDGRVYSWSAPPHDGHAGRPPGCRCRPEALLWK